MGLVMDGGIGLARLSAGGTFGCVAPSVDEVRAPDRGSCALQWVLRLVAHGLPLGPTRGARGVPGDPLGAGRSDVSARGPHGP